MRIVVPVGVAVCAAVITLTAQAAGKVEISFVAPEKYSDIHDAARRLDDNLKALRHHLEQAAAPYVADGQTLKIDVLDVDLAGRVEPATRPDDVRVLRGEADWPRIHLRYTLDAGGSTLRRGDAWLSDMAYLQRLPPPDRGMGLAYERRMIDEWLRSEFKR
ncbi:MAG TPA: DUF3016 domain-containing protein [Burkholderiaceae bacterium]|nr:DUF3016 domain-containing protein [Burkholderiaceae bacterium]